MKKVNIVTICVASSLLCSPAVAQGSQSGAKKTIGTGQSVVASRVERIGATSNDANGQEGKSNLVVILGALSAGITAALVALGGGGDDNPVSP